MAAGKKRKCASPLDVRSNDLLCDGLEAERRRAVVPMAAKDAQEPSQAQCRLRGRESWFLSEAAKCREAASRTERPTGVPKALRRFRRHRFRPMPTRLTQANRTCDVR